MDNPKVSSTVIGNTTIKGTIIGKYTLPRHYHNTGEQYEFVLADEDERILLMDQGRTIEMLDKVFELGEVDVIKNLVAILKEFKIVQKEGRELFIEISPWDGNINERENHVLNEAIFTLFACVSFMDSMKIFYV